MSRCMWYERNRTGVTRTPMYSLPFLLLTFHHHLLPTRVVAMFVVTVAVLNDGWWCMPIEQLFVDHTRWKTKRRNTNFCLTSRVFRANAEDDRCLPEAAKTTSGVRETRICLLQKKGGSDGERWEVRWGNRRRWFGNEWTSPRVTWKG